MTRETLEAPERGDDGSSSADADREHVRRVLRARAQALARKIEAVVVEETTDLVTLDLAGRGYAIETGIIREVFAVREVTPLPTAPECVLGITNVRGKIVAVLDLRIVLGLEPVRRASGRIIIVDVGGVEVGLDVGDCGIARVPRSRVRLGDGEPRPYIKALAGETHGVLDLERIIADTRQTAASLAGGTAG